MNAPAPSRRGARFHVGFLLVALIIAGGLSYFASPHPDGLDSVTLQGCQVTEVDGAEQLDGDCIAQHARDSATAGSPLADYSIVGGDGHRRPGRGRSACWSRWRSPAGCSGCCAAAAAPATGRTARPAWAPGTRIRSTGPATRRCTGCRPR